MAKQHSSKQNQQPQVKPQPKPDGYAQKGASIPRPPSNLSNNSKKPK